MSPNDGERSRLDEIERQVERASEFTHTALSRLGLRLNEIEKMLYGALDVLLARGVVSQDELEAAADEVQTEMVARGEIPEKLVALRMDREDAAPTSTVDCAARMHVCHAVCCKLDFALSAEEVEGGRVKWDLGRPYYVRHHQSGYCHHNHRETGACGVYQDRPGPCRAYSCENDKRIWKDFAEMELNGEWLEEHLGDEARPRLMRVLMQVP